MRDISDVIKFKFAKAYAANSCMPTEMNSVLEAIELIVCIFNAKYYWADLPTVVNANRIKISYAKVRI